MGYNVTFEIQVEAMDSFEAARTVQDWLRNNQTNWQFYVQDDFTNKVVSVDLTEDRKDAVLPVDKYEPLIK